MTYRQESRLAYDAVMPSVGELAQRVLDLVRSSGAYGATCDEAMAILGLTHQTASPRFTELEGKGLIVRTDQRRLTRSGNAAAIYILAEPGGLFSSRRVGRADAMRAVVRAALTARATGDWMAFDAALGALPKAERARLKTQETP
jgi:hypothetical protein